ncbi:MAG TPA: hypothetical protein VKI61_03910 [Chitinophagaceae bacterium]|jgi:hypothetical protein|nr:hypothetical protein [Chitinophagaceae bacterium]
MTKFLLEKGQEKLIEFGMKKDIPAKNYSKCLINNNGIIKSGA